MTANQSETVRRRVSVPLDPEVLIEALVLARLEALPKRRRADWVRGLLVKGFLTESRLLRSLQTDASAAVNDEQRLPRVAVAGFTFGEWGRRPALAESAKRAGSDIGRSGRPGAPKTDQPGKPFAHLRKVVG